jgi:hypothetical protein
MWVQWILMPHQLKETASSIWTHLMPESWLPRIKSFLPFNLARISLVLWFFCLPAPAVISPKCKITSSLLTVLFQLSIRTSFMMSAFSKGRLQYLIMLSWQKWVSEITNSLLLFNSIIKVALLLSFLKGIWNHFEH